jgi:hypothetical protein
MPPRYAVEKLPAEQFEFLLKEIANGGTDRSISLSFEQKFNTTLSKSSLARWREAAGNELADRYRFVRFQAKQLQEDLRAEDADKYKIVIDQIEDRLLTATKEIISEDPLKLLSIQQEEKRRSLKERELALKERALDLEKERVHGVALDRVKLGEEFSADLLEFIGGDREGLAWFTQHAKPFEEFLKKKYGAAQS